MSGRTLAEAQAELAEARTDLSSARHALQYSIGDKQVIRANIADLRLEVTRLAREVGELEAVQSGATSPDFRTAEWA